MANDAQKTTVQIKQEFCPAFKVFSDGKEWEVQARIWKFSYSNDEKLYNAKHSHWLASSEGGVVQEKANFPEMGAHQIEEIWKHYKDTIWVSNYGYVANIPVKEAEEAFGAHRLEEFKQGFSFRTCNLPGEGGLYKVKDLLKRYNFVPTNRQGSGYQINLYVEELKDELHNIVANAFLVKEDDDIRYSVHHIDNNSYNNSVTNLIYIKHDNHWSSHAILHPLSHCSNNYKYQTFDSTGNRMPLQATK